MDKNIMIELNDAIITKTFEITGTAEQTEEPKEGEEMTYNEIIEEMKEGMIPVSALYDEAQHTEPEQITAEAVEDFRQEHGEAAAADLLALIGADRFSGDYSGALETLRGIATRQKVAQEQREERERKQAETDEENRRHCSSIADEVEEWADGNIYKCPHCGECYNIEDAEETENGHRCPECGEEIEERDEEPQSLYEYFTDVLDIEYRIDANGEYKSVRLMVAFGGPNIYIDTASASVELYWWGDRASAYFSRSAADEIDYMFSEIFSLR